MKGIDVHRINPADGVSNPLHSEDKIEKLLHGLVGDWQVNHLKAVVRIAGLVGTVKRFRLDPDYPGVKEFDENRGYFRCSGGGVLVRNKENNGVTGAGDEIMGVTVFLNAGEVSQPVKLVHFIRTKAGYDFQPAAT